MPFDTLDHWLGGGRNPSAAYAVEDDYVDPAQLHAWLETKPCEGLFQPGKLTGPVDTRSASAQGMMAGSMPLAKFRKFTCGACRNEKPTLECSLMI